MARYNRRRSDRLNPLGLKKVSPRAISKNRRAFRQPSGKPASLWTRFKHLGRWRKTDFTWRRFFVWVATAFAVFVVGMAGAFAYYVRELPNPNQLSDRPIESTKVVDRNGKSLYSFYGSQNRTLVTFDQISTHAKQATVAVEDADFYKHSGFSLRGIARAVYRRVTGQPLAGGGSTITQQYIKNALLKDRSQSFDRKFKELILAIEVEQRYSKDEILTGYLNEIPYGSTAYGIEAAAQMYFGKSAKDLTLSESATLAAIPQLPTYYSPYGSHLEDLFARKDYVLNRMVRVGFITQEEADKAKAEAPTLENQSFKRGQDFTAQHFTFYVRQKMIEFIGGDPTEAERELDEGGYVVKTSLDLDVQKMAQEIMAEMGPNTVRRYQASNAALVATDPKTGEVLAMVGSIDYEDSKSGNTNFANALLQPGSSFKPFVYATAFGPQYKFHPGSITYDLETDFGGGYKPHNYDSRFRGPITNRNALAQSLNIPAVKNLYLVGVPEAINTAKKLGINSLNANPSTYGLSLVLGSGEVRPVEMAGAFGAFANEGRYNPLRPILTIEKDGKVVKDFTTTEAVKVLEPEVAYQVTSILSDNAARTPVFGARSPLILPDRPVAAKTGTTNNNRDAWTVGYTPQISVAVWVGNNEANKTMTKGADGSFVAAPIWNRFMREYLKDKPVAQFAAAPASMKQITIDKLSGKLPTDQSPSDQRVTELLAPWQVPTEFDDVHIRVKIDKLTGKLASDQTPPEFIEERIYFIVHSEAPDKPGWEIPVQQWALANGGGILPPKETTDIYTEGNRPTISFLSPQNNSKISGSFTIEVAVGGSRPIRSVEFFIDNNSIAKRESTPWRVDYSVDSLSSGSHTIEAVVTNDLGLTRSTQITISKQDNDKQPPGTVLNLTATNGSKSGNKAIKLNWANPSDGDLARVLIYQSSLPGNPGSQIKSLNVSPNTSSTYDVQNLNPGTYYFTLYTMDSNGNRNDNGVTVSAQVLP